MSDRRQSEESKWEWEQARKRELDAMTDAQLKCLYSVIEVTLEERGLVRTLSGRWGRRIV